MKGVLHTSAFILLVVLLTAVTQVGGLILLACLPLFRIINRRLNKGWKRSSLKFGSFLTAYLILSSTLIPVLAGVLGRVPLPVFGEASLKPLNLMTCILNRHYVNHQLRDITREVSNAFRKDHGKAVVSYLDANFPFINNFPLLPHLSHNDGEKIDLAFLYQTSESKIPVPGDAPSFIGYGVFEEPRSGETNMPQQCADKGFWQYSILGSLVPQGKKNDMELDEELTKDLIKRFVASDGINKIFIEPHLKERMMLTSPKVRFHGCRAVRHDDHIHLELK